MTDGSQVVRADVVYKAFGDMLSNTGDAPNMFYYIGQWGYQTELPFWSYVRRRYLASDFGRWLSREPDKSDLENSSLGDVLGAIGKTKPSLGKPTVTGVFTPHRAPSAFNYVSNNPIGAIDPSGLKISCLVCVGCAGTGILFLSGGCQVICLNPPPLTQQDYIQCVLGCINDVLNRLAPGCSCACALCISPVPV